MVPESRPRARIGTSGWKKPPWRGHFYPKGLVQREELRYAAERLSSLEINTTFHGLPRVSTYHGWYAETPDDFVFSVKGNRAATHDHLLASPSRDVADFLASGVLDLREKLGPILWQIPPRLTFSPSTVEAFLSLLPHSVGEARRLVARHADRQSDEAVVSDGSDRPIRHALEVRHESFRNDAFIGLLRRYDVAAVVTNSPGWPTLTEVTSDFVYVRLHGDAHHYPNGYDEAALDFWAEFVTGRLQGQGSPDGRGTDVFVYFDNPDNEGINSPLDAMRLRERLDGPTAVCSPPIAPTVQPTLWEE